MNENETMEVQEAAEVHGLESADQPETQQGADGFLDGWDGESAAAGEPADQPEAIPETAAGDRAEAPDTEPQAADPEAGQTAETPGDPQTGTADQPRTWNLRHMDEERAVGEAEMVTLAQKGLDYDRIREKYDASKPVMELFGQFAKEAGMSVGDYVSHIRTQAKQAAGLSEAEARRAVSLEDREASLAAREAEEAELRAARERAARTQSAAESRRQAEIAEFQKTFPDAAREPASIPKEVWADVRSGLSLVAAYSKYAVAQAEAARQAAERRAGAAAQNQRNADRATGSLRGAGDERNTRDPFLLGWDA